MNQTAIFDGHNDVLLRLWKGRPGSLDGFASGSNGHIDVPRAKEGGFSGGFFAIFVPGDLEFDLAAVNKPKYALPLPDPLSHDEGLRVTLEQAAVLIELDRRGDLALCRTVADIEAAMDVGRIAALMHIEGAEAIGPDLAALDVLYAAGLRSVGPVWSRHTIFGYGVPLSYPADPDIGPGLTDHGKALAQRVQDLGMVFDLSHLNAAGFWDVAELGLPLIATHSNAHAICPHARNLTDDQLRAIGETGGIVGLNYVTAFLRPDGQMLRDGAYEHMIPHLDHMIELAGEDHVGLGSDFDGGVMPAEIGSVAGLGMLRRAMDAAGYGEDLIAKICHGNWLACLRRVLGG